MCQIKEPFLSPIVNKNLINLHYITEFFFFLMKIFFLFTKVIDVHYRKWGNTERITCKIILSPINGMIIILKYFYYFKVWRHCHWTSWVILGKSLNLSESSFPPLKNGNNCNLIEIITLLWALNGSVYVKHNNVCHAANAQ